MRKVILSLCDYTGVWSDPYADDYDVIKVDLKHGSDVMLWPSGPSMLARLPREFADVTDWRGRVHGILAAPDCRVFAGSGALRRRSDDDMREGLALIDACLRIVFATQPDFWCLENPVGKLRKWIGPPRCYIQPYEYGDPYTKKTALWGNFNIPEKTPVEPEKVCKQGSWVQRLGGKSERTKMLRSVTPAGFAKAFREANP